MCLDALVVADDVEVREVEASEQAIEGQCQSDEGSTASRIRHSASPCVCHLE